MRSLLELPEDVLIIIGGLLDTTTLFVLARMNARLFQVATRLVPRLRISSVTSSFLDLLSAGGENVRSLNLSNCYSESTAILSVIAKCSRLRELNVVNCRLPVSQLWSVLPTLTELETLDFTFLAEGDGALETVISEWRTSRHLKSSLLHLYVELDLQRSSTAYFPIFLNRCVGLQKLHVVLIGHRALLPSQGVSTWIPFQDQMWQHLKTVIISGLFTGSLYLWIPGFVRFLFAARLKESDLDRWISANPACLIYENGNLNTLDPCDMQSEETNVLRDAYVVELNSDSQPHISLPWFRPRGLKVICGILDQNERLTMMSRVPLTWSSDLVELDLTEYHSAGTEGREWSKLIQSSPALESMAIPSCFSYFWKIKLKKLHITCYCPFCYLSLARLGLALDLPRANFLGIRGLAHLEELTLDRVNACPFIFSFLINTNVRIVRVRLTKDVDLSYLEEFIQRSLKLRYFKLETPRLELGSDVLWDALAQGRSLEQICIGTQAPNGVNSFVMDKYLPQMTERGLKVLHIHADNAHNKAELLEEIQDLVDSCTRERPHREFHFESTWADPIGRLEEGPFPLNFPGRSLCWISNQIAKVKLIGWDSPE